eukprot:scaffold207616_cov16-Prasinocladus_malaysianus.AAC.1
MHCSKPKLAVEIPSRCATFRIIAGRTKASNAAVELSCKDNLEDLSRCIVTAFNRPAHTAILCDLRGLWHGSDACASYETTLPNMTIRGFRVC